MSKYGKLIKEARKPVSQKAGKPEILPTVAEPEVNLSIKVPLAHRRHWSAEAKRKGTTLTDTITQALTERFGLPQ